MKFSKLQHLLIKNRVKELGYLAMSEKSGLAVSLISHMMANTNRHYREETVDSLSHALEIPPFFFRYLANVDMASLAKQPKVEMNKLVDQIETSYQKVYEAIKPTT